MDVRANKKTGGNIFPNFAHHQWGYSMSSVDQSQAFWEGKVDHREFDRQVQNPFCDRVYVAETLCGQQIAAVACSRSSREVVAHTPRNEM